MILWPAFVLLAAPGRATAFSLPGRAAEGGPIDKLEAPRRALAVKNDESCKASCDEGRDFECDHDWSDDKDEYVGSCDTHPTTSCDRECLPAPSPPPKAPWHGMAGTWPYPPPPPPPVDWSPVVGWGFLAAIALVLCCFACLIYYYRRTRHDSYAEYSFAYWCCCLLPCLDQEAGRGPYDPCEDAPEAQPRRNTKEKQNRLPLLPVPLRAEGENGDEDDSESEPEGKVQIYLEEQSGR